MQDSGNLTPSPRSIIAQIEQTSFDWRTAYCELIDNAFDAGATIVEIVMEPKYIVVRDDGKGSSNTVNMFRSGFSIGGPERLGRYGVGLKDACIFFARREGTTTIASVHGSMLRVSQMCYQTMIDADRWHIEPEKTFEATPDNCARHNVGLTGTAIHFELVRRMQPRESVRSMVDWLGFIYEPALENGKQIKIVFSGEVLLVKQHKHPPMTDEVAADVWVGKKKAAVRCGLVKQGHKNTHWGLSYYYGFRCIMTNTSHGCGGVGVTSICASVKLDDRWTLGRNKTEVTDKDWEELGTQVEKLIAPVLKLAQEQQQEALITSLAQKLSDEIRPLMGKAKRPGPKKKDGTIKQMGTKRTVQGARLVAGIGDVLGLSKAGVGKVTIEFCDMPDEQWAVKVDDCRDHVLVNKANSYIAKNLTNYDVIKGVVITHLVQHRMEAEKHQRRIAFTELDSMEGMDKPERFRHIVGMQLSMLSEGSSND
jgi:hypothetical protein